VLGAWKVSWKSVCPAAGMKWNSMVLVLGGRMTPLGGYTRLSPAPAPPPPNLPGDVASAPGPISTVVPPSPTSGGSVPASGICQPPSKPMGPVPVLELLLPVVVLVAPLELDVVVVGVAPPVPAALELCDPELDVVVCTAPVPALELVPETPPAPPTPADVEVAGLVAEQAAATMEARSENERKG